MCLLKVKFSELEMCLDVSVGVCTCTEPFQGPDCSIDGGKPPSNVKTELNCNGFCKNVVITGEGFFESDAMQCEFTKIEVSGAVVTCLCSMSLAELVYWQFISPLGIFSLINKFQEKRENKLCYIFIMITPILKI